MSRKLTIFLDSGDTVVDESTEVRNDRKEVIDCRLYDGMRDAVKTLKDEGHTIVMVADGLWQSFQNIYNQHDMADWFAYRAVSEVVGEEKPSQKMFYNALEGMNIPDTPEAKSDIVMIGNNAKKDIVGANRFGIKSILVRWSPRYDYEYHSEEEKPTYAIDKVEELLPLLRRIAEN